MYVSIINAETSNHMIHEKEAAKCEGIFGTANTTTPFRPFTNHEPSFFERYRSFSCAKTESGVVVLSSCGECCCGDT